MLNAPEECIITAMCAESVEAVEVGREEALSVETLSEEALSIEQIHQQIDRLEEFMLAHLVPVDQPLQHFFTPGLYTRVIFNPAGSLITTFTHKTTHPFVLLQGKLSVFIPGVGVEVIEAPHMSITREGTRRVIYAHEDSIVATYHANPTDETDLAVLEKRLVMESHMLSNGLTAHEYFRALLEGRLDVVSPRL